MWEKIDDRKIQTRHNGVAGEGTEQTFRAPIKGGALFKVVREGHAGEFAMALTFVPMDEVPKLKRADAPAAAGDRPPVHQQLGRPRAVARHIPTTKPEGTDK